MFCGVFGLLAALGPSLSILKYQADGSYVRQRNRDGELHIAMALIASLVCAAGLTYITKHSPMSGRPVDEPEDEQAGRAATGEPSAECVAPISVPQTDAEVVRERAARMKELVAAEAEVLEHEQQLAEIRKKRAGVAKETTLAALRGKIPTG